MAELDWRLASGNPFGEFVDGFQQGRETARQKERDNLFAQRQEFEMGEARRRQEAQDAAMRRQEAVGAAIGKNDYAGARQAAGGDLDMLSAIGKLDAERKAQLSELAEVSARQLYTLRGLPPEQQAQRWQQIVPSLVQRGLDPKELEIDFSDPTAIEREIAEAMSLKDMIAQTNAQRDDERAALKDREMQEYRDQMLALAGRREGRMAAGGGGRSGGGGGRPAPTGGAPWERKW